MKTYLRLRRPRLEAALRLSVRQAPLGLDRRGFVAPDPFDDVPVEVIDLATGPFEQRFPDLAQRSRARSRGRR
jgi:hypothetical protein